MVGLSSTQLLAFSVVVLAFLATIAYLSFQAKGRIRSKDAPDIPPSMQPGPSDADLEKPRLEKLQGWSLLFVAMFVVWVPLVWLKEPSQNQSQEAALLRDSIARGRDDVELYSQTNQGGIGCVRCHGDNPPLGGGFNLYNGVRVQVPNLRTVCAGPNVPQHSA